MFRPGPLAAALFASSLTASALAGELTDAKPELGSSGVEPASEDPPEPRDASALDPARRALNTAVAVGPGTVVHGAGHFAQGRPETARRLALTQALGFGTLVGGLAGLALTGASRYFVGPLILVSVAGGGMFFLPYFADVYGTAVVPEARGVAPRLAPLLVSELGHRYVYDPQFQYRHFLVQGVDLRLGAFHLASSGWFALDDENARVRVLGGYRLSGQTPNRPKADGSFLDLEAAVTHHRFDSEGFRVLTGEVQLSARRDLASWDADLRGTFVDASMGLALQRFEYRIPGMTVEPDTEDLLLARYGFGVYLGRGESSGEAEVYYDHRHDDFAAGLKLPGLGSGTIGHFGASVRWFFGSFGLSAEGQVGSVWLAGASMLFRQGGMR